MQQTLEDGTIIRPLSSAADYAACIALQHLTWGDDFSERVPASILMVCQKIGGVAAGAFVADGSLAGFVFALAGLHQGRPVGWSDMLAVHPRFRDRGLGLELKKYQRLAFLANGIDTILWTFDPLEARNAHLNINKLGAEPEAYLRDVYALSDSTLHQGIGTDRLQLVWRLRSSRAEKALAGVAPNIPEKAAQAPVCKGSKGSPPLPAEAGAWLRIAVPEDIQRVKAQDLHAALQWRAETRAAFEAAFAAGYRVAGFFRSDPDKLCYYVLARASEEAGD